ncbi:MAG: glycosyltransferase [Treponema sp.]|nr:glycosyltransferase [Treponema sp.]
MYKVSVLVPIYNTAQFLSECIESIIHQTYSNLEIILVDDGSEDESLTLCEQFSELDSRIKIIHQSNGGLVSARIRAINEATGSFILCVDSDDYIDTDMIEKMVKQQMQFNADVVCTGYIKEKESGSYPRENYLESGVYSNDKLNVLRSKLIYSGNFYQPGIMPFICNKLIEKNIYKLFQSTVPLEITRGEDVAVMFPLLLKADCIIIDNTIKGYHYRKNKTSICHTIDIEHFKHKKILYEYLQNKIPIEEFREQLEFYELFGIICGIEMFLKSKKNIFKMNKCLVKEISAFCINKKIINTLLSSSSKYNYILKGILKNNYLLCIIKSRISGKNK